MHELERLEEKVRGCFPEVPDGQYARLAPDRSASLAMDTMTEALEQKYGLERASEIAFHLCDWNSDAAFIVAFLLYPERFKKDEIEAGVELFLIHAVAHVMAAAHWAHKPLEDVFDLNLMLEAKEQ